MWVTQTYLGNPEPDASLFIYYLHEDYAREQVKFTENIQRHMEDLGTLYGSDVSLFVPNSRFTAQIGAEIRGIKGLWSKLSGKLPGLLVASQPLSDLDVRTGDFHYFELKGLSVEEAAETIQVVRQLADDQIQLRQQNGTTVTSESFWQRLLDSIEAKPGIGGFSIDLKRLSRL